MYEITISPSGRILFNGSDFGSRDDCIANWPDYAAEIAEKHDLWSTERANAPAPVPTSVTPLQARKALREAGLKASVDAYIATLSEEEQEAWEYCIQVERANATIAAAATALGLTSAQVDDLFRLAATL